MQLSIVSSLYQSAPYIEEFIQRISLAAAKVADSFEIILVNDGSKDASLSLALSLQNKYCNLKVIDLSRNFGHHVAMMTGLRHAQGDKVYLTDCDLEEPPELLVDWWNLLERDPDLDVVIGVQKTRNGDWFDVLSGTIFYNLIKFLSPVELPKNSIVSRLMTSRYVNEIIKFEDRELYLFGIMAFAGFKQTTMPVKKTKKSTSTYTLFRRFALFSNAFTNFSNYPLYFIFYLGLGTALFSCCYMAYAILNWIFDPTQSLMGWTSIVVSIWLVGGIILTSLGIIGIYLAKIFIEVKRRPFSIIRNVYPPSLDASESSAHE